ncbi:MAG: RNA polymerase sigma-70 factor [Bacteroidales bacterium]|nr:MAG: RNA polymerase sigma-70 factor [Bacteroidales bacterium]
MILNNQPDLNPQSDLLNGVREKSAEAFEELYKLYYADLTVFAQGYVYQQDIAEDLVQETIYQLWETASSQRITKSIKSYLYASIRNKCLNYLRHLKVEDKYRKKEVDAIQFSGVYEMVDDEELIEKIKLAIEDLPEKCRLTFKMFVLQDMKYKEIAEELNLSINTVKDHMKRAYRFLREYRFNDYFKLVILFLFK